MAKKGNKEDVKMANFVLKRKIRKYNPSVYREPSVRVRHETYEILASWANETGSSLTDMVYQAVNFAAANLSWDSEDGSEKKQ